MKLHREGNQIIPISILIIAGLWILGYSIHPILGYILALPGIALIGIIFNFFRNPDRDTPIDENLVISPCDGKVVVIEEVEDQIFLNKKVIQLSVFMSPLDVHANRNPITGEVKFYKYFPGKFLMAFNPKSSQDNEQNYVAVDNGKHVIAYKQIAGFLARRIKCYVGEGDQVKQGAEYGFIRFGSRIDLLLPIGTDIQVKLGDRVTSGESILAKFA